ncbi:MobA/MobL family protein [Paraburkholderia ferrariae]|uniref:MobA/MobL family protein n=1 Tax=Paraburkholderia ferrariae TaxID=386056 RepID=UPI000693B244|nr:MobA/MobL family protein [Paraburkholderia ferrariae]
MKRGKVGNGAAHAAYVHGHGKYADRDDVRAVIDGNLPNWAADAAQFFAAADKHERKNGRAYLEVEAAIPREAPDPVAWAQEFAGRVVGERFPYRLAVHDRAASDGGRNVHMHLMFSDRPTDGGHYDAERFFKRNGSKKDRDWNRRDKVQDVRSVFEQQVQTSAPTFTLHQPPQVAPEPKIGPALPGAGWRYEQTRRARLDQVEAIRAQRRIEAAAELGRDAIPAPLGLIDLSTDLRTALAERDRITQEQTYEQRRAEFLDIDPGLLAARRGPEGSANGLRRLSECRLAGAARYEDVPSVLPSDARDHRRGSKRVHNARLTAVLDGVGREMEQPAQLSPERLEQFEAGLDEMLRSPDLDSETRLRAWRLKQAAEDERKSREARPIHLQPAPPEPANEEGLPTSRMRPPKPRR